MEPASDHQVQDEPVIVVQPNDNTLAEAAEGADGLSVGGLDGRKDCPEEKGIRDADLFERLAKDALLQRVYVNRDVGQFGHAIIQYKAIKSSPMKTYIQRDLKPSALRGERFRAEETSEADSAAGGRNQTVRSIA